MRPAKWLQSTLELDKCSFLLLKFERRIIYISPGGFISSSKINILHKSFLKLMVYECKIRNWELSKLVQKQSEGVLSIVCKIFDSCVSDVVFQRSGGRRSPRVGIPHSTKERASAEGRRELAFSHSTKDITHSTKQKRQRAAAEGRRELS